MQEILDELAKIDLVVNFKCTDDFLIKHQEGSISAHCYELCELEQFLCYSQHRQLKYSTIIAEGAWKDKLRAYVEKVNGKPSTLYLLKLQHELLTYCYFPAWCAMSFARVYTYLPPCFGQGLSLHSLPLLFQLAPTMQQKLILDMLQFLSINCEQLIYICMFVVIGIFLFTK